MAGYIVRWGGALLALTLAGAAAGMGLPQTAQTTSALPAPADGARLYRVHCATCHGVSARGDGPLAESLRRRPADLTEIRRRYHGFPTDLMTRIVDGRQPVRGHGSFEMPVWGNAFRSSDAANETTIRERIVALVEYLEAIQARNTE
jgi:mono/diheme cytochrome c family protein